MIEKGCRPIDQTRPVQDPFGIHERADNRGALNMSITYAVLGGGRQGTAAAYEPVEVQGVQVSPREVLHTLLDPKLRAKPGEPDLVIVRVQAIGKKNTRAARAVVELIDRYDEATGFPAIERTTGWDGSIKAIMNAQGVTPRGVQPAELAVPGPLYAAELRRRGFRPPEPFTPTIK